ncbi:MAG: macro domain-containing protein [Nitrosopumilaceae archaeon]
MIEYSKMNIVTVNHGIIGHGVNCKGVMGAGIALAIKTKWPEVYNRYHEHVKKFPNDLLGTCYFVRLKEYLLIANMFTQQTYGRNGKYANVDAIRKSFNITLERAYQENLPVYIPKIGCGLGGLDWERDVRPVIENCADHYSEVKINIVDL